MPDTGNQAVYFEPFAKRHDFKHNAEASFGNNFARLARLMKWQRGSRAYAEHLASATAHFPELNTLVAYDELASREFVYTPGLHFDAELERLATFFQIAQASEAYLRHYAAAKLVNGEVRSLAVERLEFFRPYTQNSSVQFLLRHNSTIDRNFQALAVLRKWGESDRITHWNELMQEARTLVGEATQRKALTEAAPSETSSVPSSTDSVSDEQSVANSSTDSVSVHVSSFAGHDGTHESSTDTLVGALDRVLIGEGWGQGDAECFKQWCLPPRPKCKKVRIGLDC